MRPRDRRSNICDRAFLCSISLEVVLLQVNYATIHISTVVDLVPPGPVADHRMRGQKAMLSGSRRLPDIAPHRISPSVRR
jgi:hypothetical protein